MNAQGLTLDRLCLFFCPADPKWQGTEVTLAGLSVQFPTEEKHIAGSPAEPKGRNETKTQILCGCKSRQDPWTGVTLSHPLRVLCSLEGWCASGVGGELLSLTYLTQMCPVVQRSLLLNMRKPTTVEGGNHRPSCIFSYFPKSSAFTRFSLVHSCWRTQSGAAPRQRLSPPGNH